MPSDYDAITKSNIEELGKRTSSRKSQVNLYSQPTHFIYELLQNADDYGATNMSFKLTNSELVVEHNGAPFREENVRAISDFENSTSRNDVTKTGRFGLGFKSVFAFTATPQIISGDERFEIYGLYRLRTLPRPSGFDNSMTRIALPFNHELEHPDFVEIEKSPKKAFEEIEKRLMDIGLTTLLFTKSLLEIRWSIGSTRGHYLKEAKSEQVSLSDGVNLERYFVFSRDVEWNAEKLNPVSVAFLLKDKRIVSVENRSLFVLFETALETHLGFLINGAFRTTPSRENIRYEDDLNKHLVGQLSELLGESLARVKALGLLDVEFLKCLPISIINEGSSHNPDWRPDYPLDWPFFPFFKKVKECFFEGKFLPADVSGKYVCAEQALLARGEELRSIFPDEVSMDIWGESKTWLSGEITADKSPMLRRFLLHNLKVKEVGSKGVIEQLTSCFFENRSNGWLLDFYLFVSAEVMRKSTVKSKRIPCIPLQSGQWVGADTNVVFPIDGACEELPEVMILRSDVLELAEGKASEIRAFLKELGVSDISENHHIQSILKTHYRNESSSPSLASHLKHMRRFVKYWKQEDDILIFDDFKFLASSYDKDFHIPKEMFLDAPLENTKLEVILCEKGHKLSAEYKVLGESFLDFVKAIGVLFEIKPVRCSSCKNPQIDYTPPNKSDSYRDVDYKLPDELEAVIDLEDKRVSILIWNMMSLSHQDILYAFHKAKYKSTLQKKPSQLIICLRNKKWIPSRDGSFCTPQEMTHDKLLKNFEYRDANGWLTAIGFGEMARQASAKYQQKEEMFKKFGISRKIAEAILLLPLEKQVVAREKMLEVLVCLGSEDGNVLFPERSPKNPERRAKKVAEGHDDAPAKTSEKKMRTVRTSSSSIDPKPYLLNLYTTDDEQVVCQMCEAEMPFKLRDGSHHFEAVQLLDSLEKESHQTYLALCPTCAAKYRFLVKNHEESRDAFTDALLNDEETLQFSIDLHDPNLDPLSIRFTKTHLLDIQTVLKKEEDSQGEA